MEEKCKKGALKQDFYKRAVKNCYENFELWLGYMRELEKNNSDSDAIQKAGITAIEQGGQNNI